MIGEDDFLSPGIGDDDGSLYFLSNLAHGGSWSFTVVCGVFVPLSLSGSAFDGD